MSSPPRTYDEALAALYALVPRGIVLGRESIRDALAAWGNPQLRLPAVHIAGTNGKGSVSAMVEAGLRASGKRTGLYTSPHLHRFVERIRIDGAPVDDASLARSASRVLDAIDAGRVPALTFFEATTLVAWDVFAASTIDIAVLEVGLGGRLDATTECAPAITAITRIARDHEARLGDTLAEIAREKAGILKHGVPCVLGAGLLPERGREARTAILETAAAVGVPLVDAPRARVVSMDNGLHARVEVDAEGGVLELTLALAGAFQVENAAVAVALLERLGVSHAQIAEGLSQVVWPARLERVGSMLFDAAHNPDGAEALCRAIDAMAITPERRALVFGASNDKDWRRMLDVLGPRIDPARRFFCAASLRRAESPETIAAYTPGSAMPAVRDAVDAARAAVGDDGLVIVCGSIFAVAEARGYVLSLPTDPLVAM